MRKQEDYPHDETGYDNWVERTPHWDRHKDGLLIFKDWCIGSANTPGDYSCSNRGGLAKYTVINSEGRTMGSIYLCEKCLPTHKYQGWSYIREEKIGG